MDSVASHETWHHESTKTIDACEAVVVTRNKPIKTTFSTFIGCHEYSSLEMWRAALMELVSTAMLIFTLTCSIIACLDSHQPDPKLVVPIVVFIIVFLFLIVTVPLSGGHMSPTFTLIAALKGVITFARGSIYILAQCIGSIIGFILIKSVMSPQIASKYSLGGCIIDSHGRSSGLSVEIALVLEFSCTFMVLFIATTVAFDKKRCKELGLAMVCVVVAGAMALAVFVSITVTGRAGYAGVGLNPARCLGPALLQGGLLWEGHWVFWIGPFLACIVYYGISKNLPREGLVWVEGEFDFLRLAGACFGHDTQLVGNKW